MDRQGQYIMGLSYSISNYSVGEFARTN